MLAIASLTTLSCFIITYLFRNYNSVPSSIPGPLFACFTDLWRAYKQYNGQLRAELVRLRAEHGPVVRYGVKSVSIGDPKAVDIIYGSREGFVIADSYNVLVGISNGKEVPSLVSTRNEIRHGQLRRSVAGAFTVRSAQDYERFVGETITKLLDTLRKGQNREFDLSWLLVLYSMESAARQAFNESLGYLDSGNDIDGSIGLIRDRFRHWGIWSSLPWLERLVLRNPVALWRGKGQTPSAMVSRAALKLKERMSQEKDPEGVDMLGKFIAAHHANPGVIDTQGIVGLLMSTISGAGDTTAATLTAVFYFLMKHRDELGRLRVELMDAGLVRNKVPASTAVNKLPYLGAVIKEAMRLYPVQSWPLERLVPAGGIVIAGQTVPQGTSVGIFQPAVHFNVEAFGTDAKDFKPQRWVDASHEKLKAMEQAFMGFSRGRRVCLGQNVAIMQMKKVVSTLVMNFDFQLVDAHAQLEADFTPAVAALKPLLVLATPLKGVQR